MELVVVNGPEKAEGTAVDSEGAPGVRIVNEFPEPSDDKEDDNGDKAPAKPFPGGLPKKKAFLFVRRLPMSCPLGAT